MLSCLILVNMEKGLAPKEFYICRKVWFEYFWIYTRNISRLIFFGWRSLFTVVADIPFFYCFSQRYIIFWSSWNIIII
jgi:hypothetical protein